MTPRYCAKLMQSLITDGWILIVNTVATAYNPKTHSRQSGAALRLWPPSSSSYSVGPRYANTDEVMGTHRSNKHAHPPFEMKESKRETKYLRRNAEDEIISVYWRDHEFADDLKAMYKRVESSSHPVIHAKLHPGDIFAWILALSLIQKVSRARGFSDPRRRSENRFT